MFRNRLFVIATILLAAASLAFAAAACGDDDGDDNGDGAEPTETTAPADGDGDGADGNGAIDVELSEFAVTLSESSAAAGSVTFSVSNDGDLVHDFIVIASDSAPDALPYDEEAFAVDEEQVDVIASTEELDTGQSEDLAVELEAGNYILICNVPTHYESGMTVGFTVE